MKMITNWESCKKFKFDHTNQESILENETHKLFKHFEIQKGSVINVRQTDLEIVNNNKKERTYRTVRAPRVV